MSENCALKDKSDKSKVEKKSCSERHRNHTVARGLKKPRNNTCWHCKKARNLPNVPQKALDLRRYIKKIRAGKPGATTSSTVGKTVHDKQNPSTCRKWSKYPNFAGIGGLSVCVGSRLSASLGMWRCLTSSPKKEKEKWWNYPSLMKLKDYLCWKNAKKNSPEKVKSSLVSMKLGFNLLHRCREVP